MRILFVFVFLTSLVSAQQVGVKVRELYEKGEEDFFAGKMAEAIAAWDQEIALVPRRGPHHWQRGLALYYAEEYDKGVAQFVSHQTVNGHDVENAVWHFLCVVRGTDGSVEKARKNLIPIEGDSRVPMSEVHDLFAGKATEKEVLDAASKGAVGLHLRNQKCYAHLYLGLYYEALGETAKAKVHMKKSAVDFRMDHYMGMVAQLHHRLRSRPNIIFLFADDQRADTIGAHGNPHIKTPHLDELAAEGMSFRQNYCAGSFSGAVCVASRAMLMTGRHWMSLPEKKPQHNWGDSVVLPAHLEENGYRSYIVGKWHNGQGTLNKSFHSGKALYMGGMADHTSFQVQDLENGKLHPKRDAGGFSSAVFADAAIEFIEKADEKKPFFLYVAFMAPHDPRNPPEKYREMYYANRPPLPPNYLQQHPFQNAPMATSGRDEGLAPWPRTKEVISDQLCEYYGLVTHLDEQVGRIKKALAGSAHANNTYIVYTADHGLGMGSHGLLGKQNVYEQSMKCPLIIWGPDVPKGKSSNAITYVHDLYATICGFAKTSIPENADAKDLGPVIRGELEKVHDTVFLPFQNNQRAVRDEQWKLHVYPQINHRLLFDLKNDPHETKNLAEDPQQAEKVTEMMALMEKSREEHGDRHPLSVENPAPKDPKYDNAKRTLDIWQPKWIRDKYFDGRSRTNHGKK